MGVGIREQNTFGAYIGDQAFLARLSPEAQAEVAQWSNPVMPIADYLALLAPLHDAFPDVDVQFPRSIPTAAPRISSARFGSGRRVPLNVHLLETPYQGAHAVERWGQTSVEWLAKTSFLGPGVICAHCMWLPCVAPTACRSHRCY